MRIRSYQEIAVSILLLANGFGVGLELYAPDSAADETSLEPQRNRSRYVVSLSRKGVSGPFLRQSTSNRDQLEQSQQGQISSKETAEGLPSRSFAQAASV